MQNLGRWFILCITITTLTNCSHYNYAAGTFQHTQIIADGDLDDWRLPLRFEGSKGNMQYAVSNDDDNIYISLSTANHAMQMKILRAGMDIYIDPAGGESKNICISFPLKGNYLPMNGRQRKTLVVQKPGMLQTRQEMVNCSNTFHLAGFAYPDNHLYDVNDSSKIKIALKLDETGNMAYEAIIPAKTIFGNSFNVMDAGHKMSVGIVINAMKHFSGERSSDLYSDEGELNKKMSLPAGKTDTVNKRNPTTRATTNTTGKTNQNKENASWYQFKFAHQ